MEDFNELPPFELGEPEEDSSLEFTSEEPEFDLGSPSSDDASKGFTSVPKVYDSFPPLEKEDEKEESQSPEEDKLHEENEGNKSDKGKLTGFLKNHPVLISAITICLSFIFILIIFSLITGKKEQGLQEAEATLSSVSRFTSAEDVKIYVSYSVNTLLAEQSKKIRCYITGDVSMEEAVEFLGKLSDAGNELLNLVSKNQSTFKEAKISETYNLLVQRITNLTSSAEALKALIVSKTTTELIVNRLNACNSTENQLSQIS